VGLYLRKKLEELQANLCSEARACASGKKGTMDLDLDRIIGNYREMFDADGKRRKNHSAK
jgi:hypothetical protein